MTETEAFIAGWAARLRRDIEEIDRYIESWTPNGPSRAAADAIKKRLQLIPTPKPE